MMVNGYSANESGRLDDDTVRHLVADLKQIFPGIGEQIILGKIYQNHGNYESIVRELESYTGPQRHPQRVQSASLYPSTSVRPPFDRYNFNDELPNPAGIYLQRRAISTDRLMNRRPDVSDIRRERSVSDITGLQDMRMQPTHRPAEVEMNRSSILLQLSMQQESFERMEEKVKTLRKDAVRIQEEIHREEEELNTRSKVQRNPTEKDVAKLRREIEILTKEVQEANNMLDRVRGGMNNGSNSPKPNATPPVRFPDPQSSPSPKHPPYACYTSGPRFPIPHLPQRTIASPEDDCPGSAMSNPQPSTGDNQIDSGVWSCLACTYYNHPDLQNCEICDTPR